MSATSSSSTIWPILPTRREVSRWHMPGQHVAGGETPTGPGYSHRLHHAMRCGDELWAAVWHAGFRVLDASDIANPNVIGSYRWPPAIPEPTHTVMPLEQTDQWPPLCRGHRRGTRPQAGPPARLPLGAGCDRSGQHRGGHRLGPVRARLPLGGRARRPLRRAPVPRKARQDAGLRHLVRRRPAGAGSGRSAAARRGRALHARAGSRRRRRNPTTSMWTTMAGSICSTACTASTFWR